MNSVLSLVLLAFVAVSSAEDSALSQAKACWELDGFKAKKDCLENLVKAEAEKAAKEAAEKLNALKQEAEELFNKLKDHFKKDPTTAAAKRCTNPKTRASASDLDNQLSFKAIVQECLNDLVKDPAKRKDSAEIMQCASSLFGKGVEQYKSIVDQIIKLTSEENIKFYNEQKEKIHQFLHNPNMPNFLKDIAKYADDLLHQAEQFFSGAANSVAKAAEDAWNTVNGWFGKK